MKQSVYVVDFGLHNTIIVGYTSAIIIVRLETQNNTNWKLKVRVSNEYHSIIYRTIWFEFIEIKQDIDDTIMWIQYLNFHNN